MSNSKAPPLGTGACHSLRSGQQTAGLPSVGMLSTPPLVARLLQIKTHTYAHKRQIKAFQEGCMSSSSSYVLIYLCILYLTDNFECLLYVDHFN